MFQSTRPRGARPKKPYECQNQKVSIHAPARGATYQLKHLYEENRFNPRARAGRDLLLVLPIFPRLFQSTRPRGARHVFYLVFHIQLVSIHAPARGATLNFSAAFLYRCFNPRARAGRDVQQISKAFISPVSIHAPARGATGNRQCRKV